MKLPAITPGPWATSRDAVPEWHVQSTVYAEESGKRVATVFEDAANIRTIAAVPEMLAALLVARKYIQNLPPSEYEDAQDDALDDIRAALLAAGCTD